MTKTDQFARGFAYRGWKREGMPIIVLTCDLALRLEHLRGLNSTTFRLEQHPDLNFESRLPHLS